MLAIRGVLVGVFVAAALTTITSPPATAGPCDAGGNPIACENSLPGNPPSEWDIRGSGDASIQGFATDISVNAGQSINFKIDTLASTYRIDLYRLGYYDGDGARKVGSISPSANLPQHQPQCITDVTTELYDCGNWGVSATWNVPSSAVSGVYIAKLTLTNDDASHITFVVRNDASHSDLVFQTSDPTWQAYNTYGGSDFYQGAANGRAYQISYNRPVLTRDGIGGRDFFFSNEYPLVRFLERNGYDVSYLAGVDTDRRGSLLTNHKVFLSVGHDEYWSGAQRANVEAARDAGVSLMFLSGNEVYWRTRYLPSADASHTPYRTLVSYKETWANAKIDPSNEWTGTWRDPRFAPKSAGGGRPENGLTGTMYQVNHDDLAVSVSAVEGKFRLWRNAGLASLPTGAIRELAPHTVGYESDEDIENSSRPPGLIRLSTTTGPTPEYLRDFGNTVSAGTTTHHLTMYRAPSGALVFAAGSVQWTWGLDDVHDTPFAEEPADARMQQAQVNLLADMGAQPATLMSGLLPAAKSTDTTGPTVTVNTPAGNSTVPNGDLVTVSGTASDVGGQVAGVEVSTDGGAVWRPATGTNSWTFTYHQRGQGSTGVRVRAMDDSANQGPVVTRSVNVTCPCSVFGKTIPEDSSINDSSSVELGLRFTPTTSGYVSGVKFFKGAGNDGVHVGTLWSSSGQPLASATFTAESGSGWQTVTFPSAFGVNAGTTYVVSYSAPEGHYAAAPHAFASDAIDATPLLVAGGFGAQPAGVYGSLGSFPSLSYQSTNYFVDPIFTTNDNTPLVVTNQWPAAGSSSVPTSTSIYATYSKPLAAASQAILVKDSLGRVVAGTVTYNTSSRTITFTPSMPLDGQVTYSVTLSGTDVSGNPISAGRSWTFTTMRPAGPPGVCPCTLFDESLVPTVLDSGERRPVTLGVRFASSKNGTVTGIRFYKGAANTGTHIGALWSSTGTMLAQGIFTDESTSGWQTLSLGSPVPIAKDTEYFASFRTLSGAYSLTPNAFNGADLSRSPLRVSSDSGAFSYPDGFPGGRSSSNYLVDVVFDAPAPGIALASQSPGPNAIDVGRNNPVVVAFTNPIRPGASLAVTIGGAPVVGSTVLSQQAKVLTFSPSSPYPADTVIEVSLTGVVSTENAVLPNATWTFRTTAGSVAGVPESLFGGVSPAVAAVDEGASVELGTAFSPSRDGVVSAIRFYKGTGNGGTHVGHLWTSTGTLLATATFTGETATGWQTAALATPIPVNEDTTYVVSYLAPLGHYSTTPDFFSAPWANGNLRAPGTTNGRYLYGSGGFPTFSWNATNYFVDVIYAATLPTIAVVGRTPAPNATEVAASVKPSISLSHAIADGATLTVTAGGSPVAGAAALSADRKTITFTPNGVLSSGTRLTVTVEGVVSQSGAVLATDVWTFDTEAAPTQTISLFGAQTPATAAVDDWAAVELGMAFTPSVNGTVTAIRFYKGPGNTGSHVGSIWAADGTRLATATFANETASGWQTAALVTPLSLSAGSTYVVSYLAPNGHYSVSGAFFATPFTNGPLTAPAGNNGRYRYGGGLPTSSWNSTNYFVDVIYRY